MKVFRLSLLVALVSLPRADAANRPAVREVTVYSIVTAAGKQAARPAGDDRPGCILASGGRRDIGGSDGVDGDETVTVLNTIGRALERGAFRCVRGDPQPAELMIVCHWGHALPPPSDGGPEFNRDRAELLALVGGAALAGMSLPTERADIIAAANDRRYFLILSAYNYAAFSGSAVKTLLWRTQMSVPSYGLTARQAWPLLAAAGSALFGRQTATPLRIVVELAGMLNPDVTPH